jgi:hypothetical protein
MRNSLPILAIAVLAFGAGAANAAPSRGHGNAIIAAPPVQSATPSTGSSAPPPVNPGLAGAPPEFGLPAVNSGAIAPLNLGSNFGALPGSPGSATYDPNAALPSLDNPGSALAPNPGTSAAGFGSPNTNGGASPSLNGGG